MKPPPSTPEPRVSDARTHRRAQNAPSIWIICAVLAFFSAFTPVIASGPHPVGSPSYVAGIGLLVALGVVLTSMVLVLLSVIMHRPWGCVQCLTVPGNPARWVTALTHWVRHSRWVYVLVVVEVGAFLTGMIMVAFDITVAICLHGAGMVLLAALMYSNVHHARWSGHCPRCTPHQRRMGRDRVAYSYQVLRQGPVGGEKPPTG